MKISINVFVLLVLFFLISMHPLLVYADKCDDLLSKARQNFSAAHAALEAKDYVRAESLYKSAGRYYERLSRIKNCWCPKMAPGAKKNIPVCRKNAALARDYIAYNQAAARFNQGNSFARNHQWEYAVNAFEDAEKIWGSIASTNNKNGRKAEESAKRAHELANLARERMNM